MNRWILKALLSHYWRHPWQTLFLLLGLTAGVGLWSAVQIINHHAEASYAQADSLLGVQASYWIRNRAEQGVAQADYIKFRRAGLRQIFPVVEGQVSTGDGKPVSIIATDLFALSGTSDNRSTAISGIENWLEFVQKPYRAWVPEQLADELILDEGERLQLRDGRQLPPALIQSEAQQGRRVLMDIGAAFALFDSNRFDYLAVGQMTLQQFQLLDSLLPDELELVENHQQLDLSQLTQSLHTHLSAMSLLSFAVGLFIVFNAVRFSLWYRRETLLNLRLMGVSAFTLVIAILLETLVWSLIGTVFGVLSGLILGSWLLPGLSASLFNLYGATIDAAIAIQFSTLLQAWLITLLGLLWALAWPMYLQLKHDVLDASSQSLRYETEKKTRRRLVLAALVLLIFAAILFPLMNSAVTGFVLLGLLLFAAAWILPTLLACGLRLAQAMVPERRLIGRWMVSDGWSQMPAFRSAMMALLLAMTANLGVGTLVDSFRSSFIGWLEVRQSADIYVQTSRIELQPLLQSAGNQSWLADSHSRIGITTRWQGHPTLIRGADTRAPDSLVFPLAQWLGETPDDALEMWRDQSNAILANEQLHYLGGLQLGQTLQLDTDQGPIDYRVVGFFYDYGNPQFQFYLSFQEVAKRWKHAYSRGTALWLKPDTADNTSALELAENSLLAAGVNRGEWISQAEIRKLSVNIFERTFAITSAMNALTLIVAAIALLASLLAIMQERLPEFAQWRALGVNSREQFLIICCPLLIFVVTTWLLAIPLGAVLSWLLIHKLNVVSFGWSMPMLWQMAPAWQLGGLVLLIVVSTLVLALWQLRRRLPTALAELGELT
ncbi:MAG: putative ABC transport system permease protein [Gammaproteobacteria bacterium]